MVSADNDEPYGMRLASRGLAYARRLGSPGPAAGDRSLPEILVQRFRMDPALEEWGGPRPVLGQRGGSRTDRTRPA